MEIDGEDLLNLKEARRLIDQAMSLLKADAPQGEVLKTLERARYYVHETHSKLALA